jgi:hypothetical protein
MGLSHTTRCLKKGWIYRNHNDIPIQFPDGSAILHPFAEVDSGL